MIVSCEHGYYKFYPESVPALELLEKTFGISDLVQEKNYYTFEALRDMPTYSVLGYPLGAGIAKATYHDGHKENLLKKNSLVYNLSLNQITEKILSLNFPSIVKSDIYAMRFIPQAGCLVDGVVYDSFYGEINFRTGIIEVEQFYND